MGRALKELGIRMIPAYSPQARGRSEGRFGTWQEALPQELRLAGIRTVEEANRFLRERYIPEMNRKFRVQAEQPGDVFVPVGGQDLDRLTCQGQRYFYSRTFLFFLWCLNPTCANTPLTIFEKWAGLNFGRDSKDQAKASSERLIPSGDLCMPGLQACIFRVLEVLGTRKGRRALEKSRTSLRTDPYPEKMREVLGMYDCLTFEGRSATLHNH